jgi:adenylate kinase family enzyme
MKGATLVGGISVGKRVQILGSSCSGKSTLAEQMAELMDAPFIDLDALNWEPNWVSVSAKDPAEFIRRLQQATEGDAWVVAGSYTRFAQRAFWERLDSIIWLDLPLWQLVWRLMKRSWRRWRTKELLWGTNYEDFWSQLAVWKKNESLLYWIVTQYHPKRKAMLSYIMSSEWQHIRFIRLTSSQEIALFLQELRQNAIAQPDCSTPQSSGLLQETEI